MPMTADPKKPTPRKSGTWHTQPSWPTVALVVAMLAAMLATYALTKGEDRTETILVLGAIGTTLAALMRPLLARFYTPLGALLAVSLALGASGCGASALTAHARVYAFAAITLEATHETMVSTCTALRDACADGVSCLASAQSSCSDVATAQDAARDAVDLYQRVLSAANLAGEDPDIMRSVVAALGIAAEAWAALGRTLGRIGRDVPALPSWALDILATVGGAS